MIEIFILLTLIFILNFILKKNNFLLNYTGQFIKHTIKVKIYQWNFYIDIFLL